MRDLHSINRAQRLYVMRSGSGFSCYGFEVAERKRRGIMEWLTGQPSPWSGRIGTKRHYAALQAAFKAGAAHNRATGKRCPVDLEPALIGLEGKRVEVAAPDGTRSRFYVGKSTGWMPCHLEIKTRRSMGGCAVYLPKGTTVRVVSA